MLRCTPGAPALHPPPQFYRKTQRLQRSQQQQAWVLTQCTPLVLPTSNPSSHTLGPCTPATPPPHTSPHLHHHKMQGGAAPLWRQVGALFLCSFLPWHHQERRVGPPPPRIQQQPLLLRRRRQEQRQTMRRSLLRSWLAWLRWLKLQQQRQPQPQLQQHQMWRRRHRRHVFRGSCTDVDGCCAQHCIPGVRMRLSAVHRMGHMMRMDAAGQGGHDGVGTVLRVIISVGAGNGSWRSCSVDALTALTCAWA